jgi:hypothetical protein
MTCAAKSRFEPTLTDAASCVSGGYAQKASFAKLEVTVWVQDVTGPLLPYTI